MKVVGQIYDFIKERADKGISPIGVYGSRRCAKTWTISQFLLDQVFSCGDEVIFASMTEGQGDAGAYNDCKNIIATNRAWRAFFAITSSPRRIECLIFRNGRKGKAIFKSYKNAATAKGAACDWVYINEANAFTLRQYYAITANARKGVILDYNPEDGHFWADDEQNPVVAPCNLLQAKWQWNPFLTSPQLQWFESLKAKALAPTATSADVAFYRRYYLGEYAEVYGDIFTPANIIREQIDPTRLRNFAIIADPSNLTGADYFANIVVATDGARLYILDAYSENKSSISAAVTDWAQWCKRWSVVLAKWREWIARYDVRMIFCESNGVGQEFLRYAKSESVSNIKPFAASENKHKRIMANYDAMTSRVAWNDTDRVTEYLAQVFEYASKDRDGLHDDNIDCASTAFDIFYRQTRLMA